MNLLSKLSEVTYELIGGYFNQLYLHPLRTKSLTSCFLSVLGNYLSQKLSGVDRLNHDTLWSFGIFGLVFGASVPHYFYSRVGGYLADHSRTPLLQLLLIERFIFMPLYTFFALYMLCILEGKTHNESVDKTSAQWYPIVSANLKYKSVLQFINVFYVPPVLRVFVANMIGFIWIIYVSLKRQGK